jgi:Flp pilus assembly protein TadG
MHPSEPPISDPPRSGFLARLARCRRGTAVIEFAFIGPILILLIFGVVEYGRFLWVKITIEQGVEGAARYGVFQDKLYNDGTINDWVTPTKAYAQQQLFGLDNLTVTVTPNVVTVAGVGMVEVQAQYTFTPIVPGLTFMIPGTVTVVARQALQCIGC